ncbi:hypothetical protein NDU88_001818 [Pleurodeles waltl]|uniref:Uncharacterized protein n=1 Tax=Pleurodeles waltl TaxID=8319 RepID=A0AAV7Q9X3_PLEWA|nr:hypothetical protein NDU88_001818 [Pleurodeles waltl]
MKVTSPTYFSYPLKISVAGAAEVEGPAAAEIEYRFFIDVACMRGPATGFPSLRPGSQMALDGGILDLDPGWHWRGWGPAQ